MKKLELSITDRLWLIHNLPGQGDRITMMLVRDLHSRLEFTPEEVSLYQLKNEGNNLYKWNRGAEYPIGFVVSPEQLAILSGCIDEADKLKQITIDVLNLAAKIDALLEVETK